MSHSIFVYGTLRRAESGAVAGELHRRARYVGAGRVRGRLVDLGPYPGLLCDGSGWVQGEVLSDVDDSLLTFLDDYEGCGTEPPEYRRVLVDVEMLPEAGSTRVWTYEYVGPVSTASAVQSGVYPLPSDRERARVAERPTDTTHP